MKRRYKILPLPDIFLGRNVIQVKQRQMILEGQTPISPVFNRDGFYLDRETGQTWVEFEGTAYAYQSAGAFQYELEQAECERWMDDHVYSALFVVMQSRLASPRQRKLFKIESDRRGLHRNRIYMRKYAWAAVKRLREFKAKVLADRTKGDVT